MAKRKDGLERKALLLEAATKVFAEKGFRDTTIADICQDACSNMASVNYYFGSKDELYAEVWKNAFHDAMEKYPPDMQLTPDAAPEDQLRALVKSFLYKMLDSGELGYAGQILLMEMANPTETIENIKQDAIEPLRKRMVAILRQLLGEQTDEQDVAFCAMSVIHQCMGFGFHRGKLPPPLRELEINGLHEALSEHITRFSLAGIEAVKKRIAQP
ncbi:MAG: CerR family C-terminal domain-containing protein [Planctomycetes bacterium]|nr:CerR family C-terminal domain-containing protein [Planctomycetota bacterium]